MGGELEDVAGRRPWDAIVIAVRLTPVQRPAQHLDVGAQRTLGRAGRGAFPQLIDQRLFGDWLVRARRKYCEQSPGHGRAEVGARTFMSDLERAENSELH